MRPLMLLALLSLAALPAAAQGSDPVSRAERLLERQQFAEARQLLEPHARLHPEDARTAFLLGRAHLAERRSDDAIEWLERAVKLDARNSRYHFLLGNAYGQKAIRANVLQQAGLARKVKKAFEQAVLLDPDNLDARFGLLQYHLLAPALIGGDERQARAQADEIRRRNPYRGIFAAIALHQHRKELPKLRAEYEQAIRRYPDSLTFHFGLANTYAELKAFDEGFDLLEQLLRRHPEEQLAYYQIGRLGALSGRRLPRAAEALRRYLQEPASPPLPPAAAAHWRLGMIYEHQGLPDRARAEYRAALALDPKHREARAALQKLGR